MTQAALADFIAGGPLRAGTSAACGRSTPSARRRSCERPGATLGGLLEVLPAEAGMHLMGWLPPGVDDRVAARAALARDVDAPPLSAYRIRPARRADRGGLVLGYAAYAPQEIEEACGRLAAALAGVGRRTG